MKKSTVGFLKWALVLGALLTVSAHASEFSPQERDEGYISMLVKFVENGTPGRIDPGKLQVITECVEFADTDIDRLNTSGSSDDLADLLRGPYRESIMMMIYNLTYALDTERFEQDERSIARLIEFVENGTPGQIDLGRLRIITQYAGITDMEMNVLVTSRSSKYLANLLHGGFRDTIPMMMKNLTDFLASAQ